MSSFGLGHVSRCQFFHSHFSKVGNIPTKTETKQQQQQKITYRSHHPSFHGRKRKPKIRKTVERWKQTYKTSNIVPRIKTIKKDPYDPLLHSPAIGKFSFIHELEYEFKYKLRLGPYQLDSTLSWKCLIQIWWQTGFDLMIASSKFQQSKNNPTICSIMLLRELEQIEYWWSYREKSKQWRQLWHFSVMNYPNQKIWTQLTKITQDKLIFHAQINNKSEKWYFVHERDRQKYPKQSIWFHGKSYLLH
jgi:hypothetical protein